MPPLIPPFHRIRQRPVNVVTRVLQDTSFTGLHSGLRGLHTVAQYGDKGEYKSGFDHVMFGFVEPGEEMNNVYEEVPDIGFSVFTDREEALEAAGELAANLLGQMPDNAPCLAAIMAPFYAATWPGRQTAPEVEWVVCLGDEIKPAPAKGPKHGDPRPLPPEKSLELETALTNGIDRVVIDAERYVDLSNMEQKRFDNPHRSREVYRLVKGEKAEAFDDVLDDDGAEPPAKRPKKEPNAKIVYLYVEASHTKWETVRVS